MQGRKDDVRGWLRYLWAASLFCIVFLYPWQSQINWVSHDFLLSPENAWQNPINWQGHAYLMSRDSPTYIFFDAWLDPWRSHRSIGYPAVLYPFLSPDQQKFTQAVREAMRAGRDVWAGPEQLIYAIATDAGIAQKLEMVAFMQRVMLALAISVFYLSLCRWFPPLFSFLSLCMALWLAPPPNPLFILTEPLSCALTWLCGSFLLYAPKSPHRLLCFASACLCASCAFLIRPQTLSLAGLCSLIFVYQGFVFLKKGQLPPLFKIALAFLPLLIAYGYIIWISMTAGFVSLYTDANINFSSFCYFADLEDAKHMPTERARRFTELYGAHKHQFIKRIKEGYYRERREIQLAEDASPARKRAILGDVPLYYAGFQEIWKRMVQEKSLGSLNLLQRNIFGRELASGLQKRHFGDMLVNRWHNFLGALGYYRDVYYLGLLPHVTFPINILALALTGVAIVACKRFRWVLVIIAAIHVMAILAATFGHFVLGRYVEPTEAFLLLAGLCSLWALGARLWGRRDGNPGQLAAPANP